MSPHDRRRLQAVTSEDEPARLEALGREALDHGRLTQARAFFLAAADAAARVGDRNTRALAAIGAGGLWLYELRVVDDRAEYLALARDALAELGEGRPDLRLRLRVRLAAEAIYDNSGTVDELRALVDEVRTLGESNALAESLSLLHHAMLTPRYARERLGIANELVTVCATSGIRTFGLMGLLWRTVDLFLLGDPGAERSLGDLRLRAAEHDFLVGNYVVAAIDTMLLIRAGRMIDAEAAAAACHRLGREAGDSDADGWYLAQMFAIRWMQGRGGELLAAVDQVARSTLLVHSFAIYIWTAVALLACEAGDTDAARDAVDRVLAAGLDTLPESSAWLPALFGLAETAARLEDRATALEVEALLGPYASLPLMGSLAIVCFGATARSCGLAQRTYGASDVAVETLEDALVQQRRLGHLPMVAITSADLAETLVRRGADADAARADFLLDAAIERGTAMGLDARVAAWHARRDHATARGNSGAPRGVLGVRNRARDRDDPRQHRRAVPRHPAVASGSGSRCRRARRRDRREQFAAGARRSRTARVSRPDRRDRATPRCGRSGGEPREIGTVARRHGCAPRRDSPGRAP